jgi:hypothetical protein
MRSDLWGGRKEGGQSDPREQESQNLVEVNRIIKQGEFYSGQHDYRPHNDFNQYDPPVGGGGGESIPLNSWNSPTTVLIQGLTAQKTTSEQPML